MTTLRETTLLTLFCGALFFAGLSDTDLWSAHEARAAQNAQRMRDDHSWGLPRLYDGQLDLQKPPAFYWLVAGTASLNDGEVNRWAVRLPAACAGLLTVLLVYGRLASRGRPVAALLAGVVLAGAIHFTSSARTGRIDLPLTCAVTAAIFALDARGRPVLNAILAGLALAGAALLKGPVGIALPVSATTAVLCARRLTGTPAERGTFLRLTGATLLGVGIAAPWFVWANHATGGEFFRVFFWHHNVERALGDSPTLAVHPWWFYLPRFALDFLPWTPLLLACAVCFVRRRAWRTDDVALTGAAWFAAVAVVLSFSRFKRADYLLPAFPGAAIFLGCVAEAWFLRLGSRGRKLSAGGLLLTMLGTLAGWAWFHRTVEPQQEAVREQRAFAAHVRELAPPPQTVLLFRVESHLLAFHLRRPVHTLVEWGELNERLAGPGGHYFVTRAEFVPECLRNVTTRRLEVVARSADFARAAPLRPLVLLRTADEAPEPACPSPPPKD
jgi:4-amino-4-deoxy-L-arabinose transferase-like glycosyltransferase